MPDAPSVDTQSCVDEVPRSAFVNVLSVETPNESCVDAPPRSGSHTNVEQSSVIKPMRHSCVDVPRSIDIVEDCNQSCNHATTASCIVSAPWKLKSSGEGELRGFNPNAHVHTAIISEDPSSTALPRLSAHQKNFTMAPTQPPANLYSVANQHAMKPARIPYTTKEVGLGIQLSPGKPMTNVVANPSGDCVRFNGRDNAYAMKILSLLISDMSERKAERARVGEFDSFSSIIKDEGEELMESLALEPEQINDRRVKLMWRIFKGYNSDTETNEELDDIAVRYAKIRLGAPGHRFKADEYQAAFEAIKAHYLQHIADNHTTGRAHWAIPMVVLLNYHLISRGLAPICFSTVANEDEHARITERAAHSNTIVVNKVPIKVENRKDVIAALIQFIKDETNEDHVVAVGPPLPQTTAGGSTRKRPRRSIAYD